MLGLLLLFGAAQAATIATERIAFVNMDRLLREAPVSEQERKRLGDRLEEHRRRLAEQEEEIRTLRGREEQLTQEIEAAALRISTPSAPAAPQAGTEPLRLPGFETAVSTAVPAETPKAAEETAAAPIPPPDPAQLEKQREAIREERRKKEEERAETERRIRAIEAEIEQKVAHNVYGRLYDAVKFVADRDGYPVVLNRSSDLLLYGEKAEDITDAVLEYLRRR